MYNGSSVGSWRYGIFRDQLSTPEHSGRVLEYADFTPEQLVVSGSVRGQISGIFWELKGFYGSIIPYNPINSRQLPENFQ